MKVLKMDDDGLAFNFEHIKGNSFILLLMKDHIWLEE